MSLLTCLTICSSILSLPLVTMVIRDKVSSSVGATVRLSILKALCENNPTMRESEPASFSSKMANILRIML